ncbi:hypothetical protein R5R35_005267 [Gryllus longicercus]|uniref:Uncharacterized protein n=1 Tax=Gryllus longicercus TaxID=2509291 RepID=A0AAN9Z4L7_9ORTH
MLSDTELYCVMIAVADWAKTLKNSRKSIKWAKQWFIEREKYTHEKILDELKLIKPDDFRNFLQMNGELVDELVALVTPQIEKMDTVMRDAIPVRQQLSVTLRSLATGNTFEDMKFLTAVSPQSTLLKV